MHSALNVGGHVLERVLDGRHDIADPGKVKYILGALEKRIVRGKAASISALEYQWLMVAMRKILFTATDKVIDYPHLVTLFD